MIYLYILKILLLSFPLRHHLLCIQGFQGYGYDNKFIDNLANIKYQLDNNSKIEILNSVDDICDECPNEKENKCKKNKNAEENITKFDNKVLDRLELKVGMLLDSEDLLSMIKEKIEQNVFDNLCETCNWKKYCLIHK